MVRAARAEFCETFSIDGIHELENFVAHLDGRDLTVNIARPREERPAGGGGGGGGRREYGGGGGGGGRNRY